MQLDYKKAVEIFNNSTILYSESQLEKAIDAISIQIEQDITEEMPLFLTVMNGGMFFAGKLLSKIKKPIFCDYIHASRYGNEKTGSMHITWYRQPPIEKIQGKTIYIVDDVLDEGFTLAEVKRFLINAGAKECKIVVLVDKDINKIKPISADFIGVNAPNEFLFGYGLDIFDIYRNLPNIYTYNGDF